MWGLIAAPWFRYVLAGLGVIALLGLVLGVTYRKGYQASDLRWQLKWERLVAERATLEAIARTKWLEAQAKAHSNQANMEEKISEIVIPDVASCADPDWLRTHNDAVQAVNGS